MPNPFSYTLRSIQADNARPAALALLGGSLGFALWGLWFLGADLAVYAVSEEAHLEVEAAASPVVAERGGVVVAVHAHTGDAVSAGDVLVELGIDADLINLDGARASVDALSIMLDARKQALAARVTAYESELMALSAAVSAAESARRSAEASARQAADEAARLDVLLQQAAVGSSERDAAAAASQVAAEALAEAGAAEREARATLARREDEQEAERAELQGEVDSLQSQLESQWSVVSRAELEVERAQLRAPVSGVLGAFEGLAVGSPVSAGGVIGKIVPDGELRVIARFAPADAIGRVRPGQSARVRLDGFPWTQFGVMQASVVSVGAEPRGGLIEVALDPLLDPDSALPRVHALPGQVEVEVEAVSPATLALRAAGRLLSSPAGQVSSPAGQVSSPTAQEP